MTPVRQQVVDVLADIDAATQVVDRDHPVWRGTWCHPCYWHHLDGWPVTRLEVELILAARPCEWREAGRLLEAHRGVLDVERDLLRRAARILENCTPGGDLLPEDRAVVDAARALANGGPG